MTPQNDRIPLLDAYRFVAAFAVLGVHYWANLGSHLRFNLSYGAVFQFPLLDEVFRFGPLGVDLFFLISGFVIALSAEGRTFVSFLSSRLARIVPTYWLCVILTTLFILFEGSGYREISVKQFLVNLIFLQRALGEQFIDGVYWTILIELRFYMLVAIFLAFRLFRFYPYFLPVWAILSILEYWNIPIGPVKQLFITAYGYYFAAGSAFYLLYRRRNMRIACLTIILSLVVALPKAAEMYVRNNDSGAAVPAATLVVICYVLMAVVATRRCEGINWPWLTALGGLTYPLYLIHEDIGFILMRHINVIENGLLITLLTAVIVLIGAWIINTQFERAVVPVFRRWLESFIARFGVFRCRVEVTKGS